MPKLRAAMHLDTVFTFADRDCVLVYPDIVHAIRTFSYRPGGAAIGRDAYIGFSPYVRPMVVAGVKCVVVDERLNELEPMAFSFVMNFARDNDLPVYEGCTMPERGS